ncbi:hypothetical protein B9G53_01130 [Pseudanabaena sp. SR411]|uniref:hypothetical protein n=1 Tax=Pseudanabaena sp. SR411 TaxID=1980935 RepID=UPI000B982571|nr:hypothetical protein [Pseudanabaena sp. SR411]OYQ67586.1 hypothetical protein B9G53_01130 [Pseudanabaena sp. SR411]
MSWISVTSFNIGVGRVDAILIPILLSSAHIAIKVTDIKRRKWRKAGYLWQQFTGGVKGGSRFVSFDEQLNFDMQTDLGSYYLRFQPIAYHQGLFVEVWQWVPPATSKKLDLLEFDVTLNPYGI